MQITGSVEGDIAALMQEQQDAMAAGLRQAMDRTGAQVQAQLRAQVQAAGLGTGLEKAWRLKSYGGAKTLRPAALVFTQAQLLIQVFSEGATITAKAGRYLAIPTAEAERMGFARTNTNRAGKGTGAIPRRASMVADAIAKLGAKNTATLPLARGRKLLVWTGKVQKRGKNKGKPVPLFVLVPVVRLLPRLDVESVRAAAGDLLAGEIAAALG